MGFINLKVNRILEERIHLHLENKKISTEKDATDNEFEDGPTPASNNLKDHWPKIIYCNFILFLANNPKQLKNDETGIGVSSKNKASSSFSN